jgi:PAS domain S-box-containing protein
MARGEKDGGLIFETIMLHKSGEPVFVEVHGKLIFDQKNKPVALQGAMRDISERKSYEFARQKSEEQIRAAFESAPEGMALLDQDQQFVKVNPRLCEMLGYSAHEFQGLNFNQLTHPEDRQSDRSTWLELLTGKSSIKRNELKIIHKNGEAIWGIVSNAAVNDENGRLEYVISHIYDITERKKAENARQEAILRQREAVQAGNVGLWDWNLLTNKVAFSSEWKSQIGYQDHEIGDDFEEWKSRVHPDDLKPTLNQIQKSFEQANPRQWAEFRFRHKDGSYRWILAQASIFRDESGKPVRMLGSHVDITDRKHTEQALRLSEEKFAAAFRHSPVWVAITTLEKGEFIDVNDTFLKATGYSREEVIGHTALDLELRKDPAERERIVELVKKQGSVKNIAVKRRLRSGEIRDMLLSAELLPVPGEEVMVVVLADITELKKSQKEKDDLESQLRQAQKMEAIGTLAGGIAHDFNNILTAILGFGELLQVEVGEESRNKRYVDQILIAADRAQDLVKQILAFSRKVETEKKPLNLNHCVEEAVLLLKQTIPKMISIELHLEKDLNLIEADRGQLEQIVMNLATNAKDAMPQGGRMVFETSNVLLGKDYCQEHFEAEPGEYVRLQVSDTGQGIPKEALEQIFDPFFTTKELGKGTGLGLSTVYGIVKAHNGFVFCYSEPEMGTIFRIYLPVLNDENSDNPDSSEADQKAPTGGDETLLFVDDEEPLRQLGQHTLSKEGYKVITAASGEEALDIYQKQTENIDLIILDVSMPGMGGHNCLKKILKINPKAKILISSGYSVNGQLKSILDDGAADYIGKPFDRRKMLRLIRETLDMQKIKGTLP